MSISCRVDGGKRHLCILFWAILLLICSDGAVLLLPQQLSATVNALTVGSFHMGSLFVLIGIGCVQVVSAAVGGYLIAVFAQKTAQQVRTRLLRTYLRTVSYSAFPQERVGTEGASRLVVDVATAVDAGLSAFTSIIHSVLLGGVTAFCLFKIDGALLVLCIVVGILTVTVSGVFQQTMGNRLSALKAEQASLLAQLDGLLSRSEIAMFGAPTVGVFQRTDLKIRKLSKAALKLAGAHYVMSPFATTVTLFGQIALLLLGASLFFKGTLTLGMLTSALVYYNLLLPTLCSVPEVIMAVLSVMTSVRRIKRFPYIEGYDKCSSSSSFVGVVSDYDRLIIVPRGGRVVIAGPSGSGKSTMIRRQLGLLQCDRKPFRFECGKSDGGALSDASYFYAPQVPILLSSSLVEELGECDFSDPNVCRRVFELLDYFDLADRFKEALDTSYGEFGSELSLGEAQRLSWLRAYFSNADVLFFDEPTSSVDQRHVRRFREFCDTYLRGRTVVVATHAPELIDLSFGQIVNLNAPMI